MGSGEYCHMTLLTRHKTKDSPYFQMKIIMLRGVRFPEGGAAAPVAPPGYALDGRLPVSFLSGDPQLGPE